MGSFHGTACILLTILVSLSTGCGTGNQQRASTQPAGQTTTGDSPSQPTTPSIPPTPTPTPVPPGPENYYFSYSGLIYGFELHDDGTLTKTPGSPYDSGSDAQNSGTPSVSSNGEFVFVPNTINCAHGDCIGTNSIATFTRDINSGELSRTQVTPVGTFPGGLLTDDTGKFLYSGEYDQLRGFLIGQNGHLSPAPWNPFGSAEGRLIRHPSLPIIYAISVGHLFPSGRISAFRTDSPDGYPSLLKDMPVNFDEEGTPIIKMDPSGKFLFVLIDGLVKSNIFVWSVSSTGDLVAVEGSPFSVPATGNSIGVDAGLAVDPKLRWIYVSSRGFNSYVVQYAFNSSTGSVGAVLSQVPDLDIHIYTSSPSGQFLIGTRLNEILIFRVDPATGGLSQLNRYSLF